MKSEYDAEAQKKFGPDLEGGIKSSGERRDFGTGAHRDSNTKVHKGRMDLIPAVAIFRLAKYYSSISPFDKHERFHSLHYYNMAMDSMYGWLEGERTERDGDSNFKMDHLSYALYCVIQMMQIQEDLPIWIPEIHPDYHEHDGLRYDMISPTFIRRVSIHYQLGGINYGDRNWELGIPVMVTWDSATRHLVNWLERRPDDNEDHLAAVGWNVMCMMHTIEMINRGLLPENLYEPPMHLKKPHENKFGLLKPPEWHTGFCMSTYDPDKCFDCFSEMECIKMGEQDRMK